MLPETNKAAEYRRNATICLTMARDASEGDRAVLLEIAHDWATMAAECESHSCIGAPPTRAAEIVRFPNRS